MKKITDSSINLELREILINIDNSSIIVGSIKFFNKGIQVEDEIELPLFSTAKVRHILADMLNIKEYDNFIIIREGGSTVNANSIVRNGLLVTDRDGEYKIGEEEGRLYKLYLDMKNNPSYCKCCGRINNAYQHLVNEQT